VVWRAERNHKLQSREQKWVNLRAKARQKPFSGQSRVLKFSYGVVSPRDVYTGLVSGKRQHNPIVITKEPGAASPQIFSALVTNEVLKSVVIQFLRPNAEGVNEVQQTISLTNGSISDFRQYVGDDVGG
jgi:type VI secretion system secreted protein Hcp